MNKIQKTGLLGLILIALVVALYGQFLHSPIVFDDLYFFVLDNDGNQPVSTYRFVLLELRSLPYATLAWTKAAFGLDMIHFRVGNLLLHAATVLALFAFLFTLFVAVGGENHHEMGLPPSLAAFFAALLFALHPVSTYAAGYLVQRTIVMATLFSLLALWVYVLGSVRHKQVLLWLSVLFYYLAVFSKEHAILLPAVLIALTVLLHDDWWVKLKQRWGIFTALALIAVFVLLARKSLLGSVYEIDAAGMLQNTEAELSYPLSVVTQAWLFFKYAWLWALPNPAWMSIDMREPFARTLFSPYLIAAVSFLAWGGAALWLLLKRGRVGLVGFALLFPWLLFFTEFSSVRIQEVFVLYRSYLWVPGLFCLVPFIFAKLNGRKTAFVLTLLALAMFPMSMDRLITLSHPVLLWNDAEKLVKGRTDVPGAARIYYNRGTEMIHIGNLDQAVLDLKQATMLNPNFAEAQGNLGAAYFDKQDWPNAIVFFSRAIEIAQRTGKPPSAHYVYGRAQAYEKIGEAGKAQADFRESCRLGQRGCNKVSG
jgi:hypothetical protein